MPWYLINFLRTIHLDTILFASLKLINEKCNMLFSTIRITIDGSKTESCTCNKLYFCIFEIISS